MNTYTYNEQVDMLLVYGFCNKNGRESVRVYHEKFPNRRTPNHQTFANIERRLRENGSFQPKRIDGGRIRTTRTTGNEEAILNRVEEDPRISTRRLQDNLAVPKSTIHEVLKEELLYPFHIQKVQDLLPIDLGSRLAFCHFIQNQQVHNPNFSKKILFTDEACFSRSGITNVHNEHVYSNENPHALKVVHHQHTFKVNVWTGIIGNIILGPVVMPNRLNGQSYLHFLHETLPDLLENIPLLIRDGMWFMQDGAPPHYTLNVRQYLNNTFPRRWIGRGNDAPVQWPPRSPDLTPCDFFLWGFLKSKVYSTSIDHIQELHNRIFNAVNDVRNRPEVMQRMHFNFLKRINLCMQENGAHFEHLL
ncbi:uncharacterized protein [Euwallacea fornicatus]|uniref:uncharacterized protein n=1 Tax=Euwallacea fornicatus TaxID=995702 RepID=UPI00338FB887